ncbi:Asparagine synthetase glutamine-hydrolyzing [Paramagnetospirillum magnetotacticum MS-1]|uniref:asparagine synthase (glutamine-hydrolyzing) n=1 Tax=Paramagnetospirillum magnetotacticum MS-1 TaxID=272627 RepID=A0A0C2UY11_PARME|nr:asparagine synthase (glutamine-hydrolyzing) [Paramagnetospirillum magnetotacticum]KIL97696.1 Asparagine synthetase glutamine-hydrolyzing [Paramagnetospirillum magnetotacticum MS-1]
MCGIAGIVADRPVSPGAVEAMTGRLVHRGPDDQGIWRSDDGCAVLGHRRLSILDTSAAGHQPMERDGLVTVFNGEIYNFVEVRAELVGLGEVFHTNSDTEVLLAAYDRWGPECFARFNGMFALAILDRRRKVLVCARDRFGEKPFLFAARPGLFAFASEYKALLAMAEIGRDFDPVPLLRFAHRPATGLDDERATLFPAILQLLPGERLELDLSTLDTRIDRYWTLARDPALGALGMGEAAERFRDLLTDSIRLRLRSDVAVGSCLSGGLDSGSIIMLARRLLGDDAPYHVFTGRFPGTRADEWDYARHTSQAAGAIVHQVEPSAAGLLADLPDFLWANELPVGSASQYAQYCVFRLAKEQGVTVLLDGQGADEILGGYEQYFARYLAGLPGPERGAEEAAIRARYPGALDSPRQALSKALPPRLRHWLAQISGKGSDLLFGLSPDLAEQVAKANAPPVVPQGWSPLAAELMRDSFSTHLPVLLRYGDRNSMAHSREVRLPFCDHRIAEFALSLDPKLLMGEAQTKRLLREAVKGILPEQVRTRWNKQGFLPPQDIWFAQGLIDEAERVIEDPSFARAGYWNVSWWRCAIRRFRAGETHLGWVLWRPLMLESWRRHFLERITAQPGVEALP